MKGVVNLSATIPVVDIERAKKFYQETLGLRLVREDPSPGAYFDTEEDGSHLYIYQRAPSKADHTLAGFAVSDIKSAVEDLKAKGVQFDVYDMPGVTWEGEIADFGGGKSAWFKDSEGNILALDQGI
jgi:predicted enzyme related to lactoylglutathione lyase